MTTTTGNYNWSGIDLFTVYSTLTSQSPITLTGLMGCCCTSSGLTIYLLDYSGYILTLNNTGTIEIPSFTYSYTQLITNSADIVIPYSPAIYSNQIQCSYDGTIILCSYPIGEPNYPTTSYNYYYSTTGSTGPFLSLSLGSNTNYTKCPNFQVSLTETPYPVMFIITDGILLIFGYPYTSIQNKLDFDPNDGNTIFTAGFATPKNTIYYTIGNLANDPSNFSDNFGYYEYGTEGAGGVTSFWYYPNLSTPMFSFYTDLTGQYTFAPIFADVSGANAVMLFQDNASLSKEDPIYLLIPRLNLVDQTTLYINSSNNSLGNYLILGGVVDGYSVICTSTTANTGANFKGASTSFKVESFFKNNPCTVSVFTTNYCDSDNQPMAIAIGSSGTAASQLFTLYYGWGDVIPNSS